MAGMEKKHVWFVAGVLVGYFVLGRVLGMIGARGGAGVSVAAG